MPEKKTYHVLVVEDNKLTTLLLQKFLEAGGHTVSTAYDGVQAMEHLELLDDDNLPDCITTSIMMSPKDGFETCKEIKSTERLMHIPIIVVSSQLVDPDNQIKALSCGANDFLCKPVERTILLKKVEIFGELNQLRKENSDMLQKLKNLRQCV